MTDTKTVVPDPEVNLEPQPERKLISLEQFCMSVAQSTPVELLSVFCEVELDKRHYMGTFEEYQQWFEDFKQQPL